MTGIDLAIVLVIGVFVGAVVGLLGAGGSILTVPVLILVLGLTAMQATGTSLVVVSIVSGVGLVTHARAGRVAWRAGLLFAATGVPASIAGGYLAALLSDVALTLVLVALLLVTAPVMLRRGRREQFDLPVPTGPGWRRILPSGLVVGLMTGTLGVGGGFAVVPALVGLLGLSMPVAIGTSQLVLAINAVAGLVGRIGTGTVVWSLGLVFAGGGAVGAVVASRMVGRIEERLLTRLFAGLLVLVAASLLVELAL